MYVATVPNRSSPPAILLRESYRQNGKVLNRTLANLSDWPAEKVQSLRAVLGGDRMMPAGEAASKSVARSRTAMSWRLSPPPGRSVSMISCRAGAAGGTALWHSA